MRLPVKFAWRYIFSLRTFHFINVISAISVVGIVVGVAALICVVSIFNGFREFTENMLISFDPHLRISAKEGAWLHNADSIAALVKDIPGVKAASPTLQGRIVCIKNENMQVITLNAVREREIGYVSGIAERVIIGKFTLDCGDELPGIVPGARLADKLRALPGDTLSLISPTMIESSIMQFRQQSGIKVIVAGIFRINSPEYDEIYAFTSEAAGIRLFKPPAGAAFTVDIRLNSFDDVAQIKKKLASVVPADAIVQSWYDLHKELYDVMKFESKVSFIILSLIIIIAVFNLLASLSLTVVEKHSDISTLKAMGGTNRFIRNIYLAEGMIIGAISTVLGALLGLGLCYGQITFNWFKLDSTKFIIHGIPVSVHTADIFIIALFSLGISFIAALYPARRAAKTIVTDALREE